MVDRDEFNGLGERVNRLRENFIACEASKKADIDWLKITVVDTKKNISELYEKMDEVNLRISSIDKTVSVLWAKVTGAVVVAMAVIQIGIKVFM